MADDSSDTATVSIMEMAVSYARTGMRVFPVNSTDKGPMPGYGWTALATAKINEVVEDFDRAIQLWGEAHTSVAWALGLDGYVALDFDSAVEPAWASELEPAAAINVTRRGRHMIFRQPDPDHPPGNGISGFPEQGWGEVRGAGGYIIVAGPDRPGFDADLHHALTFPFPGWLTAYGGITNSASKAEVLEFAKAHTASKGAQYLNWLTKAIETQYLTTNDGDPRSGRHPLACEWMAKVAEESALGVYSFAEATKLVKAWWQRVTPPERHGREWDGILAWAVGRALSRSQDPPTEADDEGESPPPSDTVPQLIAERIDWDEFWQGDSTIAEWLVEGFWPLGKRIGVFADAAEGKSEWAMWCVVQVVLGINPITGERIGESRGVLYLDYEMDQDDLRDRLEGFGVTGQHDLSKLFYDQLPSIAGIDTAMGRQAILDAVDHAGVSAVVVDTYGMAIEGPENEADTVHAVLRDLGNQLKSRGVGFLIVHHAGKNAEQGARGSSALAGQVDVMWRLNRTPGTNETVLSCTGRGRKRRQSWVPSTIRLTRTETDDGLILYDKAAEITDQVMTPAITRLVYELEAAGIDWRITQRETIEALGRSPKTTNLAAAMRYRKDFYTRNPQGRLGDGAHLSTGNQGSGDDDLEISTGEPE